LDAWHASETAVIDTVRKAVLSGSPDQLYASLEVEGAVIGVARVAFGHAWAGVSTLEVAADHRRTGVAMQLMGAVADASRARGIRHMYLQVAQANSAARGLYQRLGFSTHHEYRYLGGMAH
jgi:ribosomal protein S18 acetylase RimI-like enzyme